MYKKRRSGELARIPTQSPSARACGKPTAAEKSSAKAALLSQQSLLTSLLKKRPDFIAA